MKRYWGLFLLMTLCMLPLCGQGEETANQDYYSLFQAAKEAGDEEAMAAIRAAIPQRLHPMRDRETALYGYINCLGEWVIPPQFESVDNFRGHYAAVCAAYDENDEEEEGYGWGIIDRAGKWVVEPHYFVDGGYDGWYYGGLDMGYYQIWEYADDEDEEPKFGFFDVPSGYFSGVIYDEELTFWNGSRLAPVSLNGRACYVDRGTGEVAFYLPDGLSTDPMNRVASEFVDGFAKVYLDDADWDLRAHWNHQAACIINDRGEVLDLSGIVFYDPDNGMFAYDSEDGISSDITPGGLLMARDRETGLYGYYDLNALDWRVPPRYSEADDFSCSGYACVQLGEGSFGHIDTQGNLLASGFSEWYHFLEDYAYLKEANILINAAGETVIAFPVECGLMAQWDDEMREGYDYYVSPEGLMEVYDETVQGYGVMNLKGEWVLPPEDNQYLYRGEEIFSEEGWRFFSEGLQAISRTLGIADYRTITMKDGTTRQEPPYKRGIGYINTKGEVVIDFLYDDAGAFLDGLALVERDGRYGYVDRFGHEIGFYTED